VRIVSETWNAGIKVAALSDVGMRRANNQDAYATLPADSAERFCRRGHLFVVADGMGAHAAGELASQMAAEKISQYYLKQSSVDAITALRLAVQEANSDIHRRGRENPEFFNMGTTASSIAIVPEGVIVAHVGDSRVYRLREGKFEQLTFDHSLVWEMQASGQVHPDSSLRHAIPKNVITRSLGPSEDVVVDIEGPFPVKKGDRYLLCSDGLSGQVADEEIGPILAALPPDVAARVLVDLANLRGGPDNSTLIIVQVVESPMPAIGRTGSSETKVPVPWLIVATPIFCFAAAAILGLSGSIGPMVVAILLGIIAAVVAGLQLRRLSNESKSQEPARKSVRSAPYRTYSAKPTADFLDRLVGVIEALRNAAAERGWSVDWTGVDALFQEATKARERGDFLAAVAHHSEAIVETMGQLRAQHRRPADNGSLRESALD
jgi:PPM family protein phosphatase